MIGSSRIRRPVASKTAFAIEAAVPVMPISPEAACAHRGWDERHRYGGGLDVPYRDRALGCSRCRTPALSVGSHHELCVGNERGVGRQRMRAMSTQRVCSV